MKNTRKLPNYTDYDLFIRRPADLDHRERKPTMDDAHDVAMYLEKFYFDGQCETSIEEIYTWLCEERAAYLHDVV